jgi:hypothetical protein
MTTALSPLPLQRYFDTNGVPLAGGQLYTYLAGTNTPAATYTDSTGSTPNTNPIVLDAYGQANVWLDPAVTYKFILKTSVASGGSLLWTVDNIIGPASAPDIQTGRLLYLTSVTGTNTLTATVPLLTAYTTGQVFRFIAPASNTGAVTLNINAIGAKAVTKLGNTPLGAGDILSGQTVEVIYDGTQFQLTGSRMTSTTLVTASGSTVDFTGIPSWVRKITLMFDGISFTGTDSLLLQIGGSGGIENTGYATSFASVSNGASPSVTERTDSWALQSNSATGAFTGLVTLGLLDPSTNKWVASGNIARGAGLLNVYCIAGSKAIATALQRVRLAASGANTFDAGTVSILYE